MRKQRKPRAFYEQRDKELYQDYQGTAMTWQELSNKYEISVGRIWQIINRVREKNDPKRQRN